MNLETLVMLAGGLVALLIGAEGLVRGASGLAARFGVSPLIIGLTVVALGTSSPEIAVSVGAALHGQGDIALGNIIGSNIFNVLFILGLSALITPLVVQQQLVRLDVPLMVGMSLLAWLLTLDDSLTRIDGAALAGSAIAYTVFLAVQSRRDKRKQENAGHIAAAPAQERPARVSVQLVLLFAGLALLVFGADWLVQGAVDLARTFGVSELVIGLTVIAAGTSLPEVATSIVAAVRGERDIAVGNIVGSNLFNIMAVLGIASLVAPNGIVVAPNVQSFDLPVMVAVAVACLPVFFIGNLIERWEGGLFFAYYVFYTTWLVLSATGSGLTETYEDAMTFFVLPLTLVTLLVFGRRKWRAHRAHNEA